MTACATSWCTTTISTNSSLHRFRPLFSGKIGFKWARVSFLQAATVCWHQTTPQALLRVYQTPFFLLNYVDISIFLFLFSMNSLQFIATISIVSIKVLIAISIIVKHLRVDLRHNAGWLLFSYLGKTRSNCNSFYLGIARKGVGGSQPLPGWFGATFLGRICLFLGGLDPCPNGLGHFFRRWSAPECPFECGGGRV